MKTLQSILAAFVLLISFNVQADNVILNKNLNLFNPDVRQCLIESSKAEGWELRSVYLNTKSEIIMIFEKDGDKKIYKSR